MSKTGVRPRVAKEEFTEYEEAYNEADGLSPNDKQKLIKRLQRQLCRPTKLPAIGTTVYVEGSWGDQHPCIVRAHLADGRIKAFEESIDTLHTLRSWITD